MTTATAHPALNRAQLEVVAGTLRNAGVAVEGPLDAQLIAGGRSNLTYKLTDGASVWVMRTPPLTGRTPSAHDVAREFKVTAALSQAGYPVPRPVAHRADEAEIGVPYAIAEFVEGQTIQIRSQLDALDDSVVERISDELVKTLADLHQLDHVAIGLGDFGRAGGYAQRQLKRWRSQWDIVAPTDLADLGHALAERLTGAVPVQSRAAVIHGDFRVDNTILSLGSGSVPRPRVAAVVDWELSTIGDPIADVAMMCAYRHPAFDLIVGESSAWASARFPGPINLAHQYEAAGGVRLDHWEFHLALAYFKIAVIAAGIAHRARLGAARGPGFDTAGKSVWLYLQLAADALGFKPPSNSSHDVA